MSNKYNHYEAAYSLITLLRSMHMDNYANALQESIDNGSTGNEIFMALRWNIEKLLSEKQCTNDVLDKAKKLWEELDQSLK